MRWQRIAELERAIEVRSKALAVVEGPPDTSWVEMGDYRAG